jgi:hypothetical protein
VAQLSGCEPSNWYWRYREWFGDLITFAAPPFVHRRLHELVGFETLAVRGAMNETSERWLTIAEKHVHYVVRKI